MGKVWQEGKISAARIYGGLRREAGGGHVSEDEEKVLLLQSR